MEIDTEVERVLHEIRQNLRAETGTPATQDVSQCQQALARIQANLAITERTWSRLPPIMSLRHGWIAHFELWVKRQLKRATHWFTWEQVNFNAAVDNTLRATLIVLSAHEKQQADLQAQIEELAVQMQKLQAVKAELEQLRLAVLSDSRAQ